MRAVVRTVLAAAIASGGALPAFGYPAGFNKGSFALSRRHTMSFGPGIRMRAPQDFSVAFGDTTVTITLASGVTLPAGADLRIELDAFGAEDGDVILRQYGKLLTSAANVQTLLVNLGNPITLATAGICALQTTAGAVPLLMNGANVVNGIWTADVRRNVTLTSAANLSAINFTIVGTWNGVPITRVIAGPNANTVATTATFDTVISVTPSATVGSNVSVGFGDVLGLPVRLPATGLVLKEMLDGVNATAGTLVAGVNVSANNAGDPLGTYLPNSASNGSRTWHLVIATSDPAESGPVQFPNTVYPADA